MKLYYSATSPYVRKVNVFAVEAGLDGKIDNLVTNPWIEDAGLLADNPLSKVPTLVMDDGTVLFDSPVICEYLDSLNFGKKLIPETGMDRWKALRLQALGDGILDAAILRFLERKRPEAQQSKAWDYNQLKGIQRVLDHLESNMDDWDDGITIGQITVGCALGYLDFRFSDEDWRDKQPVLAKWYTTFAERNSMKMTQPVII